MPRIPKPLEQLMFQSRSAAAPVPRVPGKPSVENTTRSEEAIRAGQRAHRRAGTPPVDFSSGALQSLDIEQALEQHESLLKTGDIVERLGEAVPALGREETDDGRLDLVDTLQTPTTVSVRASEQRLELLDRLGVLQAGVDTAYTVQASNSIEKVLSHQMAATHKAAMNLLAYLPGMEKPSPCAGRTLPVVEIARLGNAAARLMVAFSSSCLALQRLRTGGTQRVIVQHQQVVLAKDGHAILVNRASEASDRGRTTGGRRAKNRK